MIVQSSFVVDKYKKVIVSGSRSIDRRKDFIFIRGILTEIFNNFGRPDEIVSGRARGPDTFGELFAKQNKIKITPFEPDWVLYGDEAGLLRNIDMGNYGDTLIAFWDGISGGTKHMIEFALKRGLEVVVIKIDKNNKNGSISFSGTK